MLITIRVVKCHGYGGYIRVKNWIWGKKSGRKHSIAKSIIVLGKGAGAFEAPCQTMVGVVCK